MTAFLGAGDGVFVESAQLGTVTGSGGFSVGDVNGDGIPDVVAIEVHPPGFAAVAFSGLGDGTFAPPTYTLIPDYSESLGLGDFDADGHLDIAYSPYGRYELAVVAGIGDGTFSAPQYFAACEEAGRELHVEDLDSDGDLDLAFATTSDDVAVALNDGTGSFAQGTCYDLFTSMYSISIVDLDGDSVLDVIASFTDGTTVLLGVGDGTFIAPSSLDEIVVAGGRPESLAVGDWNEDGHADLVTSSQLDWDLTILLGDGAGGFLGRSRTEVADSGSRSLLVADFDQDGVQDYAVAHYLSGDVTVLLRGIDGVRDVESVYAVGGESRQLVATDFDWDGDLDLACANYGSDQVSVLENLGGGAFGTPAVQLGLAAAPTSLCAGDWNADGDPDLAVAVPTMDEVAVFLGLGDGNFVSAPSLSLPGLGPHVVTTEDFNGDGLPDLAVKGGDDAVHVLLGDGSGSFAVAGSAACIGAMAAFAAGDFDGDGTVDLVLTRIKRAQALVFSGDGDGTFTFREQVLAGRGARHIDVGRRQRGRQGGRCLRQPLLREPQRTAEQGGRLLRGDSVLQGRGSFRCGDRRHRSRRTRGRGRLDEAGAAVQPQYSGRRPGELLARPPAVTVSDCCPEAGAPLSGVRKSAFARSHARPALTPPRIRTPPRTPHRSTSE